MQARDIAESNPMFGGSDSIDMAVRDAKNVLGPDRGSLDTDQLQNMTEDISHAKFAADRVNDSQMSKVLETALEEVALAKYLRKLTEE